MRGNILNIAVKEGTAYKTIAQATSQKLSVSNQTADVKTKDVAGKDKQITGRSWTLSSDSLICTVDTEGGEHMAALAGHLKVGDKVDVMLCSYQALETSSESHTKVSTLLTGKAMVTKLDANFPNKENSTFTVELQGIGAYTVGND